MKHITILATVLFLLATVPACADSETLAEVLARHRYSLRLEDGAPSARS